MGKIIDMSLESNFGIYSSNKRPWKQPVNRPRDIISLIVGIVDAIVGFVAGVGAGEVIGIAIGATYAISIGQIVAAVIVCAVIGLMIWQMTSSSGRGGRTSPLESNGQLVNTRQASKPLYIVYGIMKLGGNWVFARPSSWNNQLLNIVVTWSEGEVEGLARAIDYTPLYSGSTKNDIHTGGDFTTPGCTCDLTCYSHSDCTCDNTCYSTYA